MRLNVDHSVQGEAAQPRRLEMVLGLQDATGGLFRRRRLLVTEAGIWKNALLPIAKDGRQVPDQRAHIR